MVYGGGGLVTKPCDSMDCSLPGSSVHGIFQARLLEWVAIAFSGERLSCVKTRRLNKIKQPD